MNIIKNKSGNYISFGGENRVVNLFFDFDKSTTPLLEFDFEENNIFYHFVTMSKIIPPKTNSKTKTKPDHENYGNGFVFRVQFKKEDIILNAILKSPIETESDNLYYEYLVGTNYVNKASTIFPCFVETYDYFLNTNANLYKLIMKKSTISKTYINNCITHIPDGDAYITICNKSKFLSLLVENVNGPSFEVHITKKIDNTESQKPYEVVEKEFNMYSDSDSETDYKNNNNNNMNMKWLRRVRVGL